MKSEPVFFTTLKSYVARSFILGLIILAVSVVVAILLQRSASSQGLIRETLIRIQQRLEDQAQQDVGDVHISARTIAGRFEKIEKVEIENIPQDAVEAAGGDNKAIESE